MGTKSVTTFSLLRKINIHTRRDYLIVSGETGRSKCREGGDRHCRRSPLYPRLIEARTGHVARDNILTLPEDIRS